MTASVVERAREWLKSASYLDIDGGLESGSIIRDLLAVVERLPVTADGVPVVPGMDIWYIEPEEHGVVQATVTAIYPKPFKEYKGDWCIGIGGDWEGGNLECYSTRQAAEEAGRG